MFANSAIVVFGALQANFQTLQAFEIVIGSCLSGSNSPRGLCHIITLEIISKKLLLNY